MTLSNDAVLNVLKNQSICGFRNIKGEPWAGKSGHHDTDAPAVLTTNGAGPHNVQMFFLSPDGTVLHCLPGFWSPADLLPEIQLALNLNRVWINGNATLDKKQKLFRQAQLSHFLQHPKQTVERSHLQNFDAKHEKQDADSDFKVKESDSLHRQFRLARNSNLKTTDQVVHERMAQRPFVNYENFDVEELTDYGKIRYDKKEETRVADAGNGKEKMRTKRRK